MDCGRHCAVVSGDTDAVSDVDDDGAGASAGAGDGDGVDRG